MSFSNDLLTNLNTVVMNKESKVIDSLWDINRKLSVRVIYDSDNESFVIGYEPSKDAQNLYNDFRDKSVKVIALKDYPTTFAFCEAARDAWEKYVCVIIHNSRKMAVPKKLFDDVYDVIRKGSTTDIEIDRFATQETYTLVYDSFEKKLKFNKRTLSGREFLLDEFNASPDVNINKLSSSLRRWEELKVITRFKNRG